MHGSIGPGLGGGVEYQIGKVSDWEGDKEEGSNWVGGEKYVWIVELA